MAVKKKTATKKKTAKRAVAAKPAVKAIKEPMTKTEMMGTISEKTGLTKKDVQSVFDALTGIVHGHIKKNGAGTVTVPGMLKIKTVRKPATKARKGINPFTGEETVFKAKPARTVVKVTPLKALKDMAN
ncbi:MAG: HU family DNA-binding protein [Gammaproteobacteria bacterium]